MTNNPAFWFLIGVFLIFWGALCVLVGNFGNRSWEELTGEQRVTVAIFIPLAAIIVLVTLNCLITVVINALTQTQ